MRLRVVAPGPNATIQDLGRPGWFAAGVGVSGAADAASRRLANRLVGNEPGAAGIECVLGGLELEATAPATLAVTGAPVTVDIDGVPVPHGSVLALAAGEQLRLGIASVGLRVYVGVRGGIDVPAVLGSRSTDTLAGLGPPPIRAGIELPVGPRPRAKPLWGTVYVSRLTDDPVVARVVPGPRDDWFERPAALFDLWVASDRLDRVGIRLEPGPALARRDTVELPSEGMPLGAIQVPPSGEPVVFLADHPITGGYPVIGVVRTADIPALAQVRPGQHIRFVPEHRSPQSSAPLEIRLRGNPDPTEIVAVLAALTGEHRHLDERP